MFDPLRSANRRLRFGFLGDSPAGAFYLRSCRDSLNSFGGGTDDIDHQVGVGKHGHVAAGDFCRGGAHPLSNEPFHVRVDGAVILGDDVPAWLRFPGSSSDFRVEQVGIRHALGRPNELLFLLGQIACETVDAFRKQPDTSVRDFDVGEDVSLWEVRLLCLRCLVGVRSERGDVDQPGNAVVGSGAGDDASAVRVTDEDGRAADTPQRASYRATSSAVVFSAYWAAITW